MKKSIIIFVFSILAMSVWLGHARAQAAVGPQPLSFESAPLSAEPPTLPAPSQEAAQSVDNAGLQPDIPHDLSVQGMFMQADIIVKLVMIGLVLASFLTWTIFIAKFLEIKLAKRHVLSLFSAIGQAKNFAQLAEVMEKQSGACAQMVRQIAQEVNKSMAQGGSGDKEGLKERVHSVRHRSELGAIRYISRGIGPLATVGSVAPFVGLFGTVWGIMNAFISISESQTTSLAVVAPGIAEALLATALGLVAAIPAVVIYNIFARSIGAYKGMLGDGGAALERMISRDLSSEQRYFYADQAGLERE